MKFIEWSFEKPHLSLPSRECGLKFVNLYCHLFPTLVTPFAGVWIEIEDIEKMVKTTLVTPFAGVWIEIGQKNHRRGYQGVTPFAGVWIEITVL